MYMVPICPYLDKLYLVPFLYLYTRLSNYFVYFIAYDYSSVLCWTYKMVDQDRYVVTLPPRLAHSPILPLFAASCGEMPSFDYTKNKSGFTSAVPVVPGIRAVPFQHPCLSKDRNIRWKAGLKLAGLTPSNRFRIWLSLGILFDSKRLSALQRPLANFISRWYSKNEANWMKNTENAPIPASAMSYWLFLPVRLSGNLLMSSRGSLMIWLMRELFCMVLLALLWGRCPLSLQMPYQTPSLFVCCILSPYWELVAVFALYLLCLSSPIKPNQILAKERESCYTDRRKRLGFHGSVILMGR